jgi:hypothetical protein
MLSQALGHLARGAAEAAAKLRQLSSQGTDERTQLAASKSLLQMLLQVQCQSEMEERLRKLEQREQANGKKLR